MTMSQLIPSNAAKTPDGRGPPSAGQKVPAHLSSAVPAKRLCGGTTNHTNAESNKLPTCLKKLVRSIVRTFYSREHSLIVDMLVRNTIMKEDDLCERLRFEKKQLRQYLHTLKTDQFIKSKLQLETDADGKTAKIIHYFIEYQVFVNVVKYRLDKMQRRLEAEQRQSSSRATFRCVICNITYTDLEVDRLLSLENPGKLECVYCRSEVTEHEDHSSRTDGRALIANFHRQVRDPIDAMLRECDSIHLSAALLEPEIRPLEPLPDDSNKPILSNVPKSTKELDRLTAWSVEADSKVTPSTATESRVRIVLLNQPGSDLASQSVKQRPIWMADSTVLSGDGLGELDRGPSINSHTGIPQTTDPSAESVTHTLAPGRIPSNLSSLGKDSVDGAAAPTNGTSNSLGGDIMQLLLVHERRGMSSHLTKVPQPTGGKNSVQKHSNSQLAQETHEDSDTKEKFLVKVGEQYVPYAEITPSMIKTMTTEEKAEYIRIGKMVYRKVMLV